MRFYTKLCCGCARFSCFSYAVYFCSTPAAFCSQDVLSRHCHSEEGEKMRAVEMHCSLLMNGVSQPMLPEISRGYSKSNLVWFWCSDQGGSTQSSHTGVPREPSHITCNLPQGAAREFCPWKVRTTSHQVLSPNSKPPGSSGADG